MKANVTDYGTFIDVRVRSSAKLKKADVAWVEVVGAGTRCLALDVGGVGECSLYAKGRLKKVSLKARAMADGRYTPWSRPRLFTIKKPAPEPTPEPAPEPEPTGFISIEVLGPSSSCATLTDATGLRVPISAEGPGELPNVLTSLSTRLEVIAGTYRITPGEFECKGITYRPRQSVVSVTVPRSITGYAFLSYVEVSGPAPPGGSTDALSVLNSLSVQAESRTGYDRSLFRHWIDADGDGCDTREEVLLEEATVPPTTSSGCKITGGTWVSPYDNVQTTDPSTFDVDHMVPLAEAWDSGANTWDAATRQNFANDLGYAGSLIAVSASSNRSKSDRDPAEWLPSSVSYRCTYVVTWIAVKYRWALSVDSGERSALAQEVQSCGNPNIDLPARAITG